jgi:hypothetical protein
MRVVNGIHVSNQRHWDVEQMLRVDKGKGAVTILHHLMFPHDDMIDQYGDVENAYWYWKLRHGWASQGIPAAPERFIHMRLYQPRWRQLDPKLWARHVVPMLMTWRFEGLSANLWDDALLGISPCNEQNIEPALATDYAVQAQWQLDFWAEVDRIVPKRRALSVFGAFAYGHDAVPDVPDSEYQVPEVRRLLDYVDVLATHPYGHLDWPAANHPEATVPGGADAYWHMLRDFRPVGWRDSRLKGRPHDPGGLLAQYPKKPFLISESGTFAHSDPGRTAQTVAAMQGLLKAAADSGRCLGVTWFIWNSGAEHAPNVIHGNADLRSALENMPAYQTTCEVPVRSQTVRPVVVTPAPAPEPTAGRSPEVHVVVQKGDGWTALARVALGRDPTVAEVGRMREFNGNRLLVAGECVRSPWGTGGK